MKLKRFITLGSLVAVLTVVALASAAVVGVIQVRDEPVNAGPDPAVADNVQNLDPANAPQEDVTSLRGTSSQGIKAWAFTTKNGKAAVAASIPEPSRRRSLSIAGGCENVTTPITRCLTSFRHEQLVIVGRADPAVAEIQVTASDGQTYAISVNNGVWAALIPAQGGSPPTRIVGSTESDQPIGSADGERIVRALQAEAAAAAADPDSGASAG